MTLKDVAEEAQVSIACASYALRGSSSISVGTRQRVAAAAKKIGYVPISDLSSIMQSIRKGRCVTNMNSVVFVENLNLRESFLAKQIVLKKAIEAAGLLYNIKISCIGWNQDLMRESRLGDIIKNCNYSGVIFSPFLKDLRLQSSILTIPHVSIGGAIVSEVGTDIDLNTSDWLAKELRLLSDVGAKSVTIVVDEENPFLLSKKSTEEINLIVGKVISQEELNIECYVYNLSVYSRNYIKLKNKLGKSNIVISNSISTLDAICAPGNKLIKTRTIDMLGGSCFSSCQLIDWNCIARSTVKTVLNLIRNKYAITENDMIKHSIVLSNYSSLIKSA